MSFHAILWAMKQDLPPMTKHVLMVIASHAHPKTNRCFPRVRTIALEASLHPRTIHRHNRVLERAGLIEIENQYDGNQRRANNYRLNCPPDPLAKPTDTQDITPTDNRAVDKKNHYSNHNNRARQEAENALAGMLGPDGWEILATYSEVVPLLVGKFLRGTLQQSDLIDLRSRFALGGGDQ
ncbi:MAG: helix-turn-helix domain-containing protein [Rhizobiales bacterium]|nr:helix-turn-helix domain-containing protein [Hyphomicrobiales bacterium]